MITHKSDTIPAPPDAPWLRICITGGIACGKSMVGAFMEEQGVAVIEADEVCHGLMRAGMPLFTKIVAAFGRDIVAPDGDIDRSLLGRHVFGDVAALARLNAILHPAAQAAIKTWILARREDARLQPVAAISDQKSAIGNQQPARNAAHSAAGGSEIENSPRVWRGGVVAIIPLLYETASESAWDRVICVGAPVALQLERLCSKGFAEKEARERMAAQWPLEEKMKRADYVVFNAGAPACARRQTVQVMQHIGIHVEKSDGR